MLTPDQEAAARELDRLGDLGRGSMGLPEHWRFQWRRRGVWLFGGALWVIAAPQMVIVAIGGPGQVDIGSLLGAVICAGYVVVSGGFAPTLPVWRHRLWLSSKIAGTTMASFAAGALSIAGFFSLLPAAAAIAVALGSATGTALLRRGYIIGAIPTIIMFTLLRRACMSYHFEVAVDTRAVHTVAFGAFGVAGALAILSVLALSHPQGR